MMQYDGHLGIDRIKELVSLNYMYLNKLQVKGDKNKCPSTFRFTSKILSSCCGQNKLKLISATFSSFVQ